MREAVGLSAINEYLKVKKKDYDEGYIDPLISSKIKPIDGSLLVTRALFCFVLMSGPAQTVDANTSLTYVLCLRSNEYEQDEVGDESQINLEP